LTAIIESRHRFVLSPDNDPLCVHMHCQTIEQRAGCGRPQLGMGVGHMHAKSYNGSGR